MDDDYQEQWWEDDLYMYNQDEADDYRNEGLEDFDEEDEELDDDYR